MKECTYGWYPPAKDIWKNYRATPDSYERECLYKHGKSRYNSQPGVATPIQPTQIQLEIPAQRCPSPTRVVSAKPPRPPTSCSHSSSSVARIRPAPRKAWTSYIPHASSSLEPQPPSKSHDLHTTATPTSPTQRPPRVQSAHSHRPKINIKHRPVKSAGVARSADSQQQVAYRHKRSSSADSSSRARPRSSYRNVKSLHRTSSSHSLERPQIPSPQPSDYYYHHDDDRPRSKSPDEEDELLREEEDREEIFMPAPPSTPPTHHQRYHGSTTTPEPQAQSASTDGPVMYTDYENQLKEHGWRMQVHGDPLNLKAPCIPPRLSYAVEVPIPEVPPEGPRGHMVNYDTNFYNTIPRRRATFDVAQDWISEVLHAKRMELQKRDGGVKYRYKNFSFVY